jgi:hypothetical protein
MTETVDFKWFNDLLDWGKSQLKVIQSHWKKAVGGILNIFKDLTYGASHTVINTIKGILESGEVLVSFGINFYCIRCSFPHLQLILFSFYLLYRQSYGMSVTRTSISPFHFDARK